MRRYKAITLVETIIYIGLLNMVVAAVIGLALVLINTDKHLEHANELERNAIFISNHLSESFSKTNTVDVTESVFDQDNGSLRITGYSGAYYDYAKTGGNLEINRNGTTTGLINQKQITVTRFKVTHIQTPSGNTSAVRVELMLNSRKFNSLNKQLDLYYSFRQ